MAGYSGYLKPHMERIKALASEGKNPAEIGRLLYAEGVRSPYAGGGVGQRRGIDHAASFAGLIRHMLNPNKKKRKKYTAGDCARSNEAREST